MARAATADIIVGVLLLVLGILVLIGALGIPYFTLILGIAAIVFGVLMLIGRVRGGNVGGIILLAVGIILVATNWLREVTAVIETVANIVVGVVLVLMGALKLMGKW